jgi:ribonuclease HI
MVNQRFLGTQTEANVFMAELLAIHMALRTAQQLAAPKVTVFSDSQASLQAITGPHPTGQQIISMIIQDTETL